MGKSVLGRNSVWLQSRPSPAGWAVGAAGASFTGAAALPAFAAGAAFDLPGDWAGVCDLACDWAFGLVLAPLSLPPLSFAMIDL